jgi:hypothetical protein
MLRGLLIAAILVSTVAAEHDHPKFYNRKTVRNSNEGN